MTTELMEVALNADQQDAMAAFIAFMASDDPELVISGGAGVGKTTLLRHLIRLEDTAFICGLLGKKPIVDWALTATTNKAAEVLQIATGHPATTIHSLLGLTLTTDYGTGEQRITRKNTSQVIRDTLIIIDEASMVDTPLRRMINECTINCKIVYVGDHCQMAPVKETISPVFLNNQPIILNTIIRAANAPPIMELCLALRQTVETGIFFNIQPFPGFIDFLTMDEAVVEIGKTFLNQENPDARILCYTNKEAIAFNTYLRAMRNLPVKFSPGEWVVSNTVCKATSSNGDGLRIEEEVQILETGPSYHIRHQVDGQEYELELYSVSTEKGVYQVPVNTDYLQALLKLLANSAKRGTNGNWVKYYNLKETIADLRPRDACTVYKAQGSTYHTVFVDLTDIGTCRNPAQAARMLYVACSRPTSRICFMGQLPPRFRGM